MLTNRIKNTLNKHANDPIAWSVQPKWISNKTGELQTGFGWCMLSSLYDLITYHFWSFTHWVPNK